MGVQSDEGADLLGGSVTLDESANDNAGDNQNQETGDKTSTDESQSENNSDDGVAGDQGSQNQKPAWTAQLPSDLKESESLTKFQNIGELGKAYTELERKLGDTVALPGESATDDERNEFYKKLGRPDSPEGYEVKFPQSYSSDVVDAYKQTAFDMGLNDKQLGGLMKTMGLQALSALEKMQESQKNAVIAGEEALRKEWGEKYDDNFKLVSRTILNYGGDKLLKSFKAAGLSNNPDVARFLKEVGADLVEHKVIDGKLGGRGKDPDRIYYD